jgi:oxygen-independent coproporphyrinogen-3 oxidase
MFHANQMGVYFHWPFCASKCPYCDFNSHVRDNVDQLRMREAYKKSIRHYAQIIPDKQVVSIFFGGGTPSLMTSETVSEIIHEVQKNWRVVNDLEVTLEANPTSVEAQKFEDFRAAGVTRISLGIQALNNAGLQF